MGAFDRIVGYEDVIDHLKQSIRMGKVNHAYLIEGEALSGKKMISMAFAQALNCEAGDPTGCGTCRSCRQILSLSHPDVRLVTHEKTNLISIDEIRSQVISDVDIRPYSGRYKVYIIPEAEKMNQEAQNALLKTLEEPPAYVVILLLTVNSQLLLETIRSRCVPLKLRPVPVRDVERYLMEELQLPDYQARICAAFGQGSIGKALRLARSEEFRQVKERAVSLVRRIGELNVTELVEMISQITKEEVDPLDLLDILTVWYRDVLYFKASSDPNRLVFRDQLQLVRSQAQSTSYEGLERAVNAVEKAGVRLKANVNFELTMELLFLTLKECHSRH